MSDSEDEGIGVASASAKTPQLPRAVPWVEKYRPRSVDDVACQEEVVRALKASMDTGNLPHLLFYGPPGTGKTSTILAIGRQLYGPELFHTRVMELNASDERGINVIRSKVKTFAQTTTVAAPAGSKYPCPPYKLIVLDEADSMTPEAQAALRRTMETYSKITRFCLICNYVSRIIDPLSSRCAKFRFKPLDDESMTARLRYISEQEGVSVSNDTLKYLIRLSEGDLRRAITFLQSAHRLYKGTVTKQGLSEIAGVVPEEAVTGLLAACRTNSFDNLQAAVNEVVRSGYAASQVLARLADAVIADRTMSNPQKAHIAMKLGEADACLVDGADEFLQLLDVASFIMNVLCVQNL